VQQRIEFRAFSTKGKDINDSPFRLCPNRDSRSEDGSRGQAHVPRRPSIDDQSATSFFHKIDESLSAKEDSDTFPLSMPCNFRALFPIFVPCIASIPPFLSNPCSCPSPVNGFQSPSACYRIKQALIIFRECARQ
jgi:hypothetical protein